MDLSLIKQGAELILKGVGADLEDPNFVETPQRVAKKYAEILSGMTRNSLEEIKAHFSKTFPATYNGTILLSDISCWSMCPHHLLPVQYIIHVAYMPDKLIIGASKPERLIRTLAKRLVLQEQLTDDIVDTIMELIQPKGVMCTVQGVHLCMRMRGVKSQKGSMITTALRGVFEHESMKMEFLELIKSRRSE